MNFELHPNLASKAFIADLTLCRVLLEDEANYPWLFLVPRKNNLSKLMDLLPEDQTQLLQELDVVQRIMWQMFQPAQLNVAAIGNKTPQLHIHIIARYTDDAAWPHTIWDHPSRKYFSEHEKVSLLKQLKEKFRQQYF